MGSKAFVSVVVKTRSRRPGILGWVGASLKMGVASPPVDGKANSELVGALSDTLGVPRNAISIVAGQSSSKKLVAVLGMEPEELLRKIEAHTPRPRQWP